MNRRNFIYVITSFSFVLVAGCTKKEPTSVSQNTTSAELDHEDPNGYWTCSMHPQVHQHEPGKCPICGMTLIKTNGNQQKLQKQQEVSSGVDTSNDQLKNSKIGKYTVERKNIEIALPVSGRLISPREVAFQVYESEITLIKVGNEFQGSPAGSSTKEIKGRITRVDNFVDPSSRTIRVMGSLQEGTPGLATESSFYGEIRYTLQNQIIVPEEAVLHTGMKDLVYVFNADNKLSAREVQLGYKGKNNYQILSGLKEGEIVSAGSNFLIDSEAKIRGQQ